MIVVGDNPAPEMPCLIRRLLAIELQRFHHRSIVDGKKHRFVIGEILVRMPLPKRHYETVAFAPLEVTLADSSTALTAHYVGNRCAGLAVRLRGFFTFDKLHFAGHSRIGITPG